jgi:hypothetical protein
MDHVVCLDAKSDELQNLIQGKKSMIIRGAEEIKMPYGCVNPGDVLYFVNKSEAGEVKAMGVVSSVFNSDKLSVEESYETIIRHQDRLQLPDRQFEKMAGKKFLVLIGLENIRILKPFSIDKSILSNLNDWHPVGRIEMVALIKSAIGIV